MSAWILSLMLFAMAVPSIFVAAIINGLVDSDLPTGRSLVKDPADEPLSNPLR